MTGKEARTVSVLLCHAHVPMALECLGSLIRLCAEPLTLRIHDDGSLTAADMALLRARLGRAEIVPKAEADALIRDRYAGYVHLCALRQRYKPIMKAFDAVVMSDGPVVASIDSDVLFLRRFRNPFRLPAGAAAVFMRDRENAYSLRSWQKLMSPRVRLPEKVNSGFVCFDRARHDLDLMEWFVSKRRHRTLPVIEQTARAFLAACAGGCRVLDPRQVRVMREGEPVGPLVAGHFTGRTRHLLPKFAALSRRADRAARPVEIRTIDAGTCTALDIARYEVRRIATRLAG